MNLKNLFNFYKKKNIINGGEKEFYSKKSLVSAYIFGFLSIVILFSLFKLTTFSISYIQNHFSEKSLATLKTTPTQTKAYPNKPIKWSIKVPATAYLAGKHLVEIPKGAEEIKVTAMSSTSTEQVNKEELTIKKEDLTKADRLKLSKISEENAKSSASEKLKQALKQEELNKIQNNLDLRKPQGFFSRIWNKLTNITIKMTAAAEDAIAPIQEVLATNPVPEVITVDIAPVVAQETQTNTENTPTQTESDNSVSSSASTSDLESLSITGIQSENTSTSSVQIETQATTTAPPVLGVLEKNDNKATTTAKVETTKPIESTPDVLIEYQTPAPTIAEAMTDTGKIVTVSDNADEDASAHTTNVLAFTNIPEIYKVGQENKIKIKWLNNNGEEMPFNTYDLDLDGKLDYVEWTVPHLSTQTFEIIFITKALELDENNEVTGDIYDLVKEQDNTWASIPSSHTVRATFAKFLTKKNDITLYARLSLASQTNADNTQTNADGNPPSVLPSDPSVIPAPAFASINSGGIQSENSGLGDLGVPEDDNAGATTYSSVDVYPVYEGIRSEQKIATFENITNAKIYKILLTNLPKSTNTFDLKVSGSIDIDYIVDPTPITVTDTFLNSSMIASMTNITIDTTNGLLSLSPASSWSCGSTLVDGRDAKTYATVLIGAQCWMQQNLNVGTMVTGVTTQGTSSVSIQKYCYGNLESGCTSGGGLYQWDQAMTGTTTAGTKGICPTGWHIPTHDEFTTLERATCLSNGTATTTCYTNFPYDTITTSWRGTNEGTTMKNMSGLWKGILPGYRNTDGSFTNGGSNTYFWSSIPSSGSAWVRYLTSGNAGVNRFLYAKAYGFSVRCLKD